MHDAEVSPGCDPCSRADRFPCSLRFYLPLNVFLIICPHMSSSNTSSGDMDAKGILAVFLQPDPSLDEDKYASILNMVKPLDLHHQAQ